MAIIGNSATGISIWGYPTTSVAVANLTSQTSTASSVCTITPSADTTYTIGGYITVNSVSGDSVQFEVVYTDPHGTSKTATFVPFGGSIPTIGATGVYNFPKTEVRVGSGKSCTIEAIVTGAGSINYDVGGSIQVL